LLLRKNLPPVYELLSPGIQTEFITPPVACSPSSLLLFCIYDLCTVGTHS
jgi:hypothetical protein